MKDSRDEKLIDAVMLLRAESPQGWELFLTAMDEFTNTVALDMLVVDKEDLPRRQGMAIAVRQLSSMFRNAPNLYRGRRNG